MQMGPKTRAFHNTHFDSASCKVHRLNRVDIQAALGFTLTDRQLIEISGAPQNSAIYVTDKPEWTEVEIPDGEEVPSGILLTVINDNYLEQNNEIVIFREGHSRLTSVYLKLIMFRDNPQTKGIAGHMLATMVDGAIAAFPKAVRLRLLAAGGLLWEDRLPGLRWGGFAAWPKYGFDAPLPSATRALLPHFPYYPAALNTCTTVSQVLDRKGGREFWHIVGEGWYMNFNLAPGSPSRARLDQFLLP
jgi:hypothetical protein